MDNRCPHKPPRVRHLSERAGGRLLFLPPYAPDCGPLRLAWSTLKTLLRGVGARTTGALTMARSPSWSTRYTTSDARR
jgi:transposase